MKKFKELVANIENAQLTGREIALAGACLLLLGLIVGILVSPKGSRVVGSNNGNDNGNNNTGALPDMFFDDDEEYR